MTEIKVDKDIFKDSVTGDLVDGFIRSQTYYKVEFILGDELEYIRHSKHDINTEYRYFKSCKFKVNNEFNTYFNILIYLDFGQKRSVRVN